MRRFVFAVFTLTVLAACQPVTTELTEEQKAEIEAAVRQVADDMYAGARDADWERIVSHWRQQDGLCLMGTTIRPCPEVREAYRQAWSPDQEVRLERQEMEGEDMRVVALTPTVAIMARTTEENRAYRSNGEVSRGTFAAFAVFVLENGEWKAHSMQQASWPIEDEESGEG
jgi:hypothetical protein